MSEQVAHTPQFAACMMKEVREIEMSLRSEKSREAADTAVLIICDRREKSTGGRRQKVYSLQRMRERRGVGPICTAAESKKPFYM